MLALIACLISSPQHLVNLFARLANDNIGYVDWTPYIPTVSHQRDYVHMKVCLLMCLLGTSGSCESG